MAKTTLFKVIIKQNARKLIENVKFCFPTSCHSDLFQFPLNERLQTKITNIRTTEIDFSFPR